MSARPVADVRLPEPGIEPSLVAGLRELLGAEHVLTDDETRRLRTRGKSTPDLLRQRAGDLSDAPDAVVRPGTHDEVAAVLAFAVDHHLAVVPFGGGTSVTGGLVARREGYAGLLSLDLIRMKGLVSVDHTSMTATLEPGLRGPEAEALLAEEGLTLGHYPQSFEYATIGGFAATRSSGQASAGYGRFDALVVALRVATPRGDLRLGSSPANAAGPDLRQLILGSEGAYGVITEVTVRVRRLPAEKVYEGWRWASFTAGAEAMRKLAQAGLLPTVIRLSDEAETSLNLARPAEIGEEGAGGCMMIAGYEGEASANAAKRAAVTAVLTELGGTCLGEDPGQAWVNGRFHAPYLRDSLLDVGVLVETLETATFWSAPRGAVRRRQERPRDLAGRGRDRALPHLARLRDRLFAVLHRRRQGVRGPAAAVARREDGGKRGDGGRRRDDHPSPRRRHRPQALAHRGDRRARRLHPAGGQVRPRPDRHPQPGSADPVTAASGQRSFTFLVNPSSGGGAAPEAVVPVARLLRDAGATVDVTYSPGPKAMTGLVSEALERGDVVVSVGGDGMLSSLAGAVSTAGGTLAVLPAGRGNDFARMLGLPESAADQATLLLEADVRAVDLLSLTLPGSEERRVAGSVYSGVDARASEIVDRVQWLPRRLQYPYAAVRSLATYQPARFQVTVDGDTHDYLAANVVVANSAYYGKGMKIAPAAALDDGLLDVVVIEAAGKLDLIRSLPKVYDGGHVGLPEVTVLQGRRVEIRAVAKKAVPVGGDGEPLGTLPGLSDSPAVIEILPGALSIIA